MNTTLIPHTLQSAVSILECLNIQNITVEFEQVRCSCPLGLLGKEYHQNQNSSNPACVVSVCNPQSGSTYLRYHCFSCNNEGDLEMLPFEMKYWASKNPEDLEYSNVRFVASRAFKFLTQYQTDGVLPASTTPIKSTTWEFTPYPETWLDKYALAETSDKVMEYLHSRGLSDAVIKDLDIRVYHYLHYLYAAFPFRNIEGYLAGMRARCIAPDSEYTPEANEKRGWKLRKHTHIKPSKDAVSNDSLVWYREDYLSSNKPILIVEGQFDVAAILPFYKNVTCLFTSSASVGKLEMFKHYPSIIILLDNADDGSTAHDKILKNRKSMEVNCLINNPNAKVIQAYYPEGAKDASSMSPTDLKALVTSILENSANHKVKDNPITKPIFNTAPKPTSSTPIEKVPETPLKQATSLDNAMTDTTLPTPIKTATKSHKLIKPAPVVVVEDLTKIINYIKANPTATEPEISKALTMSYVTIEKAKKILEAEEPSTVVN